MITQAAAIIGAITGPLGLVIAWLNYRRDIASVHVTLEFDKFIKNSQIYPENKKYTLITVYSTGRRPLYITTIALLQSKHPAATLSETFFNPNELKEGGRPLQYLAEQAQIQDMETDWPSIIAVVRTGSGHQFRSSFKHVPPKGGAKFGVWKRLIFRLKTRYRHNWAFQRRYKE